jgi:hypothetical protein
LWYYQDMQRHDLKTWPKQFCAILAGSKRYELRVNDRNFQEGDELMLLEWDPKGGRYTGRHVLTTVTYMTRGGQFGLPPNLVVMSLQIQYWNIEATA